MIIYKDSSILNIPVGLGPVVNESTGGINNQQKTADSSTVSQIITYDTGYTGLSKVTINPYSINLQNKTVNPSTSSQTIGYDTGYTGLAQVLFNPVTSSIDSNIVAGNIKKDITILGVTGTYEAGTSSQSKTVDSSTVSQTVTADTGYNYLSSVTVNPYVLESKTQLIESNGTYSFTPGTGKNGLSSVSVDVSINTVNNQSKSVSYNSNGSYNVTFDSTYTGLSSVDVSVNIPLTNLIVEPSVNAQTIIPDPSYSGFSSVTVNAVTSSIDSNIVAGNIKKDVTILDITGTYVPTVSLQNKTVDASITDVSVNADSGYDGLGTVTVSAVTSSIDSNITQNNIKKDITILGVTGTYEPTVQTKTTDPSTSSVTVTPDSGYDGLSSVTVNAVTSSIDSNIVAGNIKKDVVILGVTGTYESSVTLQSKTVDASNGTVTVTPDSGYDGLSSVTVTGLDLDTAYQTLASI